MGRRRHGTEAHGGPTQDIEGVQVVTQPRDKGDRTHRHQDDAEDRHGLGASGRARHPQEGKPRGGGSGRADGVGRGRKPSQWDQGRRGRGAADTAHAHANGHGMGLANPHRQGSGGVHEDDDAHGSSGPQRVRSKRRVGRKCRGMCWKPPPLPQSLLQRDAADRKENRKRKIKENMEEKKRKKKLKLREMEEAKRRASREEDDEEDELNGAEEDEETPAAGAGSGSGDVPPPSEVMFSEDEAALKTMSVYLEAMGHKVPTPIQERCWPACLGQCDVQARAKPGTGKTFGYMFPLLYALATGKQAQGQGDASSSSSSSSSPRALVLVPTRELAKQVLAVCRELKRLTKQRGFAVTGGVLKEKQLAMLKSRHDVTIATPGRLCDLIGKTIPKDFRNSMQPNANRPSPMQPNATQCSGC